METISPELALVDERLDTAARCALPDAPDSLRPPPDRVAGTPAATSAAGRKRLVERLLGVPVVLVFIAVAALPNGAGNEVRPSAPTAEAQATGRTEGTPRMPAEVRWRPIRGAVFYNVIFWRDGVRTLDLWPTTTSVLVPEGRLLPGVYQWFVYPAFDAGNARTYGRLITHGRLRI